MPWAQIEMYHERRDRPTDRQRRFHYDHHHFKVLSAGSLFDNESMKKLWRCSSPSLWWRKETERQADTKDLTSSSKFSASCVLTSQTIPSPIFIFKTLTFFVFKPKENGWWMEFSWRRYQCRALGNEIIHARSGREVPRKIDWRPRPRVATKRSKDVAIKRRGIPDHERRLFGNL